MICFPDFIQTKVINQLSYGLKPSHLLTSVYFRIGLASIGGTGREPAFSGVEGTDRDPLGPFPGVLDFRTLIFTG